MAIEYYSSIDLNKNELQNAVIQNAGSAPGSPSEGQIYYDSTSGDKALHFYNGSAWIRVAGQTTAQTTDTIASGDFIAFSDESETGDINNKLTVDNLFTTAPALLTEAAIADGDYIVFLDGGASGDAKKEALADLATLFAGTGLSASSSVLSIDAAQTGITSLLATDIKIGEDDQTKIDFETADTINFYAGNEKQLILTDGALTPGSNAILDLGTDYLEFKDAYFDGTVEADAITIGGTNILTGGIITTLGTISQDTVTFTSANANDPVVIIKNTTNDAAGARLTFLKDKGAAGADGDDIGVIVFTGDDAAQTLTDFGKIFVEVGEADNTDEAGKMTLQVASSDGTNTGLTSGLILTGHKTGDYVDVTLGGGTDSTVTIPGNLTVTGTTTTVNVTTTTTSSGVVFEGTTGDGHDATLKSVVAGADVTYTLPNVTGHVALFAADPSTTTISATPAELNLLDGITTLSGSNTGDEPDASASVKGIVELATAAEVITGTDTSRVVTADTLSAKSVVCDIDVSSLTDANIVTITHNLGTADILVQVYDKTTEANIMCDIARTTDDFSTASTSVVSIDFGTAPPNDCRALITSLAGATAGSIAYT